MFAGMRLFFGIWRGKTDKNLVFYWIFRKISVYLKKEVFRRIPEKTGTENLPKQRKGIRKMKKKLSLLLALTGAAVLFAGCSTVQTADVKTFNNQSITASGTSVAHVSGYTSGLYLLWIPLLTGSAEEPGAIRWNEDSVNVSAVTKMVTKNIPVPFPFILYWKTATVSGNSVK